jgi:hypothetical protein
MPATGRRLKLCTQAAHSMTGDFPQHMIGFPLRPDDLVLMPDQCPGLATIPRDGISIIRNRRKNLSFDDEEASNHPDL